jgi:hypothetical protein
VGAPAAAAVAAATGVPARWELCGGDGHVGELGQVQGKVGEGSFGPTAGRNRSSLRQPLMASAAARSGGRALWNGVRPGWVLTRRARACLQGGGRPALLAVRRAAPVLAPAQRSTARTAGHRGVRPTGKGAGSTWRGRGPQGLGVPPASGRLGLGKARATQTPRRRMARWRAGDVAACLFSSDWHCLRDKNSKFCN